MAAGSTLRIADKARPMPRKLAFTMASLDRVTCPAGKDRAWVYDCKQPGLAFMVTPTGAKRFYVVKWMASKGRPDRIKLGAFPEISVETARKLAAKELAGIADGKDPMAERRDARVRGMNMGALWKWFLETHAKRKRSCAADENRYKNHLERWADKRLTEITRTEVAALHQQVAKDTSEATANRVLALLSTMFNKAGLIGWERPNPCKGVPKFAEASRERFLSGDEMGRFLTALQEWPDTDWRDFFTLCLFTGARRGNVLSMRWDEFDLKAARWTIPAAKFKNGKASTVYLSAAALEVLADRKNKSEWVFPGSGKTGHMTNPAKAWTRFCKTAELSGVRIHDLRRTMGSWQAAGGASLAIIGKSLGHRSVQTTAVYARLELDPVKASVDAATAAMLATGTVNQETGVSK